MGAVLSALTRTMRLHLSYALIGLLRRVYPSVRPKAPVWQIIEVPRRLSETEAQQLADQITNL